MILVTGATGSQGGAVARELLKRGVKVRGLTRNRQSQSALRLAEVGAEMVEGDLWKPETLSAALEGVDTVFSVQDFYSPGVGYEGEITQGRNLAHAARSAGVKHYIQSTMMESDDPGEVAHFRSKFEIEKIVRSAGLPFTFVGTVWFSDNTNNPKTGGPMTFPALSGTLKKDTPFQILALADLGKAVAEIVAKPQDAIGQRFDLCSEVTTYPKMKADYERMTGRKPKWWSMPNFMLRLFAKDFAEQLRWHVTNGWTQDSQDLTKLIGEPTTFKDYLQIHPETKL